MPVPTKEELDALFNAMSSQHEVEMAKENTVTPKGPLTAGGIDASKIMEARSLDSMKGLQRADDAARVIAGPMGDALAAGANAVGDMVTGKETDFNNDMLYEAMKSQASKMRLDEANPGSAGKAETIGNVGKILALPGGAFATPMRAMATSAGINVSDTFFGRLENGEPVNTDAEEYLSSAAKGAGSGFLGYHVGKLIGNTLSRIIGKDPSITKAAEDAVKANKTIADGASKKIIDSNVTINPMGQHRLLRNIEKDLGKRYELSPDVTPRAWKAINVLRNRVGQGADITLDAFNELRTAVGKSLYSDSGLLLRDVTTRDMEIVDDIYKSMSKFATELPITRQFVRGGGNLKSGMQGWQQMTKFKQTQARSEKIAELITNAEAKAAASGAKRKALDQALQEEFNSLFTTQAGRSLGKRMFTPEQLSVMKKIANGDVSQKIFSTLDKWVGGSLIAPIFRGVHSLHGAAFQAEESRQAARKVIAAAGETPIARKIGSKLGVASVVEALKH